MPTHPQKLQHLYQRAGFGAHPRVIEREKNVPLKEVVKQIFRNSERYTNLDELSDPLKGRKDKEVSGFKLGLLFLQSRKHLQKLNLAWLDKMAYSRGQLREKMTFFWHDHFATHVPIGYVMQVQNNMLRKHALGNFREMLHAIARNPAMLLYLNNQQNKKDHPNENFAREVLELFTMGEGNYTEKDIKEAARAFTGWTVSRSNQFEFIEKDHDFGVKEFMGRTGNFNGGDILDIILEEKQTARYLVTKIYRWFVNEQLNPEHIDYLTEVFFSSGYDIALLMMEIFLAEWFYAAEHIGCLIKSPVELIVGYMRLLEIEFRIKKLVVAGQKALGQVLFYPPNVAGWAQGTEWIDSSSLLLRMKLPLVIFGIDDFDITIKPEYETMGIKNTPDRIPRWLKAKANWPALEKVFSNNQPSHMVDALLDALILAPKDRIDRQMLQSFADTSSKQDLIKSLVIRIMALPEYQLA